VIWPVQADGRLAVIGMILEYVGLAALLAVAVSWALAAARPVPVATGDPELAPELARLAGRRSRRVAAVAIDLDAPVPVRSAFIRADAGTLFETGSVTKALTGMVLADAIERGELSLDSTVAELLPALARTRVATVTVRELCTHTSGLPRLPVDLRTAARAILWAVTGLDPYRGTAPSRVIALAGRQRLRSRGRPVYSNLGAALLGQLLAGRAGYSYPDLLGARIFVPLGMSSAAVATRQHKAAPGWSAVGLPQQPWLLDGYAPDGGVTATIGDMARLATALLDRTAPGCGSLTPVPDVQAMRPNRRSGMFWIIDYHPSGRTMIWHNGATGGYSAFLAIFPEARRAVAVLASVSRPDDQQRIALGLARSLVTRTVR
jgi:CubicO group peptidase (beta-lactamase class C family)